MAWSNSKIFMATIEDVFENTTAMDLDTNTFRAALYDNDITPSQTVASASTAYNTGVWAIAGNEVSDGAEWVATGEPLTGVTSGVSSNVYTFDASDTPSSGTSATLANVYGCLVYNDSLAAPVAKQGLSYHYFGGANSVTDGTFTIIWNGSGILSITA